jgi:hypothetical protein
MRVRFERVFSAARPKNRAGSVPKSGFPPRFDDLQGGNAPEEHNSERQSPRFSLLLILLTLHVVLAVWRNVPGSPLVSTQIIVFEESATTFVNPNPFVLVF